MIAERFKISVDVFKNMIANDINLRPGSCHDAFVRNLSNDNAFHSVKYSNRVRSHRLLADSAYTLQLYLLASYKYAFFGSMEFNTTVRKKYS